MEDLLEFLKIIDKDFTQHRPETTDEEKHILIQKGTEVFKNYNPKIEFKCSITINSLEQFKKDYLLNINKKNNLFMCRPLIHDINLPENYEIFYETSTDIYNNYLSTINNLNNKLFNESDIEKCKEYLEYKDSIVCWSNTSILLNKILKDSDYKNIFIMTYGSPILLPIYNNNYCINVYHEDDWIFELLKLLYKIDFNTLERDVVTVISVDNNKCLFIILSKKHFEKETNEPHRCFGMFL